MNPQEPAANTSASPADTVLAVTPQPSATIQPSTPSPQPATDPIAVPPPVQQQPQGAVTSLNIEALRGYEQVRIATTTSSIIKSDPSLRKKRILAIIFICTLILLLPGVIMLLLVYLKAGKQAKAQRHAASESMFANFARTNNLKLQDNPPLPSADSHPGLLDQFSMQLAGIGQHMPDSMKGLVSGGDVEPAVSGILDNGLVFKLKLEHLKINISKNGVTDPMVGLGLIQPAAHGANIGGVNVGVGNVFTDPTVQLRQLKSAGKDEIFFTVTVLGDSPADVTSVGTNPRSVTVNGEYLYMTLTVDVGQKLMPHILITPKKNGFGLPLMPALAENINLEGNFNEYFDVKAQRGYETEVLQILDPSVMQNFMNDMSDITIEFSGGQMRLMLAIRPYISQITLADATSRLYGLAVKYKDWLQHRFSAWSFSPQQAPYDLTLGGVNESLVGQHINSLGPSHVTWINRSNVAPDAGMGATDP
ncbi:MAG TPA: hypothetical protein VFW77_04160, partial [Candidatus Saccharimonadales bacterium]|nr:hypothetical protein [Candidatus Saccharimonadales bacterium]